MKLYYHKTDGGAEYLMDTFIEWSHNGKSGQEGTFNNKTKYVVRIDGDIEKDAEISVRDIPQENIEKLIDILNLEPNKKDGKYHTTWGAKTKEGLIATIRVILDL